MRTRSTAVITSLVLLLQIIGFLPANIARAQSRRPLISRRNEAEKSGLRISLSEATPAVEPRTIVTPARAVELSESETARILSRLRPLKTDPSDEKDFAIRDRSLPPPRTGNTIQAAFPPPENREAERVESGPLEVLRFSPEGDVPLVPQISVTFSQPMVAVTSHADAVDANMPVKLTPRPQGRWRWVGTRTILFEANGHLPMATEYTAEIPAGTKSATGATLAVSKVWKFTTPPPQVRNVYPRDTSTTRDPLMFVQFDQRINREAVINKILEESPTNKWRARLATAQEIEADSEVRQLSSGAPKDRWLAFKVIPRDAKESATPLPSNSPITVTIPDGTPSAEGPRTTTSDYHFSFRTYGSMRITKAECGYRGECSPFDSWQIQFSNPIDTSAFEQSQVQVEEVVPGSKAAKPVSLKSMVYGNTLQIGGIKHGHRTFRVKLDQAIRDYFGQSLGSTAPVVFNVGSAGFGLAGPDKGMIVLDPAAPASLSVYSVNHSSLRARLYSVDPRDWGKFIAYQRDRDERRKLTPPGKLVLSRIIPVRSRPDEVVETKIDLSAGLRNGIGQIVAVVGPNFSNARRYRDPINVWVQATQIGLDAFADDSGLVGWATSLRDGKPIGGAEMSVETFETKKDGGVAAFTSPTATAANGIARVDFTAESKETNQILVARKGNDTAFLPENTYWWADSSRWIKTKPSSSLRWFVFDDRRIYKPGEEVHVKGWIRKVGDNKDGDVGLLDSNQITVEYKVKDSQGNEVAKGEARVNALGGFDTAFKLPGTINLGQATMQLEAQASGVSALKQSHEFQVQEFRRPEFEVTTQASEGLHFVGESATATVSAAYFAGGGLPNAEVNWQVTTSTARFTPPNRDDFTFGKWTPWWSNDRSSIRTNYETFASRTDASGKHSLRIDFNSADPPYTSTVTAQARVTDVNRQTWSSSTNLLVHPANLYVGLRSARTFVQEGEPLIIQSIVSDLDGRLVAGRDIRMRAVLMDWVFAKGEWKQEEKNPQECTVKSGEEPIECRFVTKQGGQYRITATIEDDRSRKNQSELTLWVAGGYSVPSRGLQQETAQLIPDRKEYRSGDAAEILVQSPFPSAEGVMTLRRSGIVSVQRFTIQSASHTLRIPIEEKYTPNIHVQVDLVGENYRVDTEGRTQEKLPKRPAFASGELNLVVPPLSRRLSVEARPRDRSLEPGSETTIDVDVKDSAGRPVAGSEVALVVVDEAILALTDYRIVDPLEWFYSTRASGVTDRHSRSDVLIAPPEDLAQRLQQGVQGGTPGGVPGGFGGGNPVFARKMAALPVNGRSFALDSLEPSEQIRTRENFDALAIFAPSVSTDSNGHASVRVTMPDSLTRYRVMAVAVAGGKQFGKGESTITARLPLMIRPSAPRFLNFGDKCELPIVVQNQTDSPMDVDVAVRASNADLAQVAGRRVAVPANDRVEVRFPVSASKPGKARFQIAGVSGKWADAAEIELPVWTPATTEAFATYGEVDNGSIAQPVKAPSDAIKGFGGIEITTSSTELQALTDAMIYLTTYPFECSEQLSSRILAIAALKDVLGAFRVKGFDSPQDLISIVERDLKRLQAMQNDDGGFGFWRRGDEEWPFLGVHVAHALARAKQKGFDVPAEMTNKSLKYLREIEHHISPYYNPIARRSLIAYSLYVRNLMGDRDPAKARILLAASGPDGLAIEGNGWLLSVLSGDKDSQTQTAAIRSFLNNRAVEEAATAHFVTSYGDADHLLLHSDRRADGIILEALIKDQPSNDLIPKLVRGLLGHRREGKWSNTQENVFALLALDRYFATYEKVTPDFVARAWLGDSYAGEHEFRGRSTDRFNVSIPMRALASNASTQNLVLSKDGSGRMYYRIGMQYAPSSLKLDPSDHGFTVERSYEAVDRPDDVSRDDDGTWHIKAGAQVRVRLTMIAPSRRYHVALVDPMPAGLEALNPALAVTGSIPKDPKEQTNDRWWWLSRPWFEHQNMRDERVEAFASLLWEGVHVYAYVARATTPGVFVVPPSKAEEMYHPETFGRSGTDRVIVE